MSDVSAQYLVDYATQSEFLDTRYVDHSTIPEWGPGKGWDCSSYTKHVMKQFGVELPAYSDSQYQQGTPVEKGDLRPGDLVFFHPPGDRAAGKTTGHVGIYLGNGQMVNAANPNAGTRIQPVTWNTYVGARRYLNVTGKAKVPPSTGSSYDGEPAGDSTLYGNEQDTLNMGDLKETYGIAAGMLNKYPELKEVLNTIIEKRITDPLQQMALLKETDFFKQHLPAWMEVEKARLAQDPAIWQELVENQMAKIKEAFAAGGAEIDDATAKKYADQMLHGSGWNGSNFEVFDADWLQDVVAGAIDYTKTKTVNGVVVSDLRGTAATQGTALNSLAYEYGMNTSMTDKGFQAWLQKNLKGVMSGDVTEDEIRAELAQSAVSLFPGLSQQLGRGLTLRQAADPYLKNLADVLEMDAGSLDLNDDLVQRVLNSTNEKGEHRPLSIYDAKLMARKDERWQYTDKAKNEYTDMGSKILKDFGFLG